MVPDNTTFKNSPLLKKTCNIYVEGLDICTVGHPTLSFLNMEGSCDRIGGQKTREMIDILSPSWLQSSDETPPAVFLRFSLSNKPSQQLGNGPVLFMSSLSASLKNRHIYSK